MLNFKPLSVIVLVLATMMPNYWTGANAGIKNEKQLAAPVNYSVSLDTKSTEPIKLQSELAPDYDKQVLQPLHAAQQKLADEQKAAEETARRAEQARLDAIEQRKHTFYENDYAYGNCTAWVASQRGVPADWGNANNWAYMASMSGWIVSNAPVVGAIAQTTAGYFGHVAYVIGIGDGTVTVSEMNVMGLDVVDTQVYPTSYFVYIY